MQKLSTRKLILIGLGVVALLCVLALTTLALLNYESATAFINYFGHPNTPIGFHGAIAHIALPNAKFFTDRFPAQ